MADFTGLWIPIEIINLNIGWSEKALLAEILSLSKDKPCSASNEYLGKVLNIDRRQCVRLIKNLNEKGLIEIVYHTPRNRSLVPKIDSDNMSMVTKCHDDNMTPLVVTNCHGDSDKMTPSVVTICHGDSDKMSQSSDNMSPKNIENINKNIDKNIRENIKENIGAKPKPKKEFVPPTRTEVFNYVSDKIAEGHSEYKAIDVDKFYNYYSEGNWHMSNGKKVKSWKQCLVTWASRQWSRPANRQETPTDRVSRMLDNILSEEVTE